MKRAHAYALVDRDGNLMWWKQGFVPSPNRPRMYKSLDEAERARAGNFPSSRVVRVAVIDAEKG